MSDVPSAGTARPDPPLTDGQLVSVLIGTCFFGDGSDPNAEIDQYRNALLNRLAALRRTLAFRDEQLRDAIEGRDESWTELARASEALGEGPYASLTEHIQPLQSRLAEREADTARLDWLESAVPSGQFREVLNAMPTSIWNGSVRALIDAAMSAAVAPAAREPTTETSDGE